LRSEGDMNVRIQRGYYEPAYTNGGSLRILFMSPGTCLLILFGSHASLAVYARLPLSRTAAQVRSIISYWSHASLADPPSRESRAWAS
jgi:hypothetical protein